MLRGSLLFGLQNVNYSGKRGIKFFEIGTKPVIIRFLRVVGTTHRISSRLLVQFHLSNTCARKITLLSASQRLENTPSKNGCRKPIILSTSIRSSPCASSPSYDAMKRLELASEFANAIIATKKSRTRPTIRCLGVHRLRTHTMRRRRPRTQLLEEYNIDDSQDY